MNPEKSEDERIVRWSTHGFASVAALQLYKQGQFPAPDPTVTLCFGEELQDVNSAKSKLVIVQVRPVHFGLWLGEN